MRQLHTPSLLLGLLNALHTTRALVVDDVSTTYPNCVVSDPSLIGNGQCDFGNYNTATCDYDGGDCDKLNQFPNCKARDPTRIGDGRCDMDDVCKDEFYNEDCGWDGGDCSAPNYPNCISTDWHKAPKDHLQNDVCDSIFNTEQCGFDGGDCAFINEKACPNCDMRSYHESKSGHVTFVCDNYYLNTEECLYLNTLLEQYPDCQSALGDLSFSFLVRLGNKKCENRLNIEECGFDHGDCDDFNSNYPQCDAGGFPIDWLNNTACHSQFNTKECKFDGGDCDEFNSRFPNCIVYEPFRIGDGTCHGGRYNTAECGWDGGDCDAFNEKYPECKMLSFLLGDGRCSHALNSEECGYDGGDCDEWNEKWKEFHEQYPNCKNILFSFADGICHSSLSAFTQECGWDGGDCIAKGYPDCVVYEPERVGDGFCDEERRGSKLYNSKECGYDGGDCIAFNKYFNTTYPGCKVSNPHEIGNGYCQTQSPEYNTKECGYDGGDCTSISSRGFLLNSSSSSFALCFLGLSVMMIM